MKGLGRGRFWYVSHVRALFRIGPILMLIPMLLWAGGWALALHEENQSWYINGPFGGFIITAALWHIALIVHERGHRLAYLVYAILNMPALCLVSIPLDIAATHFPL